MDVTRVTATDLRIAPILAAHAAFCDGSSPAESTHYLTATALDAPDILIWAAIENGKAQGIGALKVTGEEGEIKSMHTAASGRGRGTARMILDAILSEARDLGLRVLRLETGAKQPFDAARRLYQSAGFTESGPFGDYRLDPYSTFYELRLDGDTA